MQLGSLRSLKDQEVETQMVWAKPPERKNKVPSTIAPHAALLQDCLFFLCHGTITGSSGQKWSKKYPLDLALKSTCSLLM
jgi:hypothetical protein